jgi:TolB-like protein
LASGEAASLARVRGGRRAKIRPDRSRKYLLLKKVVKKREPEMRIHRSLLSCLVAGTILLLSSHPAVALEKVKPRLAILPFTMNSTDDPVYLREGVRTMLASRIAARAGVTVIDRAKVEKVVAGQVGAEPVAVAKSLTADLVLVGSITALGAGVSIDARLLRVDTGAAESFFAAADDQNGVIGAVDRLATDITAQIAGEGQRAQSAGAAPLSPPPSPETDPAAEQSRHPDRLFMPPAPIPAPAPVAVPPTSLPMAVPPPTQETSAGSPLSAGRSQFLDLEVQVMDVGDVFGAGSDQIVLAEKQRITVFRQEGERLTPVGEIPAAPRHVRIIALNLADINGNGRAEIYISAVADNSPLSYAVEWDGRNFVKLFDKQRHYLRPLLLPGQGWVLYGQQAALDGPVKPGIYKADARTGSLQAEEKLAVAESVNLYDFVMGDFTGDGRLETAVQTQDDDLRLFASTGDLLWSGNGNYGYTTRFIGPAYAGRPGAQKNLQVPTRLVAIDLNGDGRQELVAMENPAGVGALLKTVGSFVGGTIKVMGWNGATLTDLWASGAIGGYVASFQVVKGDDPRLYIAMVTKKSGILLGKLQSVVASYRLGGAAKGSGGVTN